ncbi:hypothetical protein [Elizabethkingia anophelis]|uniref:hypothetical protein n=1 Tax=Elizabethkingia anophelis TaxID=1117645 RepID=UPI0021A4B367|nr:hypothetical protein [Elizabethkingia anophelis]MDV3721083.1 hypothetical protein [Elizabethkingia anophelis]
MKKETTQVNNAILLKEYIAPSIEITYVEMEQGIAAASATVIPTNVNGDVSQQWETDVDTTGNYDW